MNNENHKIDSSTNTLTIIGLVFDGLSVLMKIYVLFALSSFKEQISGASDSGLFTVEEVEKILSFVNTVTIAYIIFTIVTSLLFVLSLICYVKLKNGKLTEHQSKKAYIYLIVWGITNLLLNPIAGVTYLASGIRGIKGYREEADCRNGI